MPIRLTGLASGLDTEAIISALVSSYSYKTDKYKKAQTKLSWKQDAWKSLNSKIYSFYTSLDNIRLSTKFTTKKTTCSDPTKATVTAGESTTNGTQKLNVIRTAQAGSLTGGKLDASVNENSTLAELGYMGGDGEINVNMADGTTNTIKVSQGTTMKSFVSSLKDAGLNANFDAANHRFFISAKETGEESDFTLTGSNVDGADALSKLGLNINSAGTSAAYETYTRYYDADGNQIKNNVIDAISKYNDALAAYESKTAQNANMSAAYGYGSAYAAMQDTLASLGGSMTAGEKDLFTKLLAMNSTGRSNSVVDASGNIYSVKAKDGDGNTIYSYKDDSGAEHLMQREITYTDEAGEKYTKAASNKYKDADGNVYTAAKDADGNTIYKTKLADGTEKSVKITTNTDYYEVTAKTVSETKYKDEKGNEYTLTGSVSGTPVYSDKDGNEYLKNDTGDFYSAATGKTVKIEEKTEVTTEYNRTTGTPLNDITSASDVLTGLKKKSGLDEKSIATLTSNINAVNTYEATKDTLDPADPYSRESIKAAIKDAYSADGSAGIVNTVNKYGAVIAANKTDITAAEQTLKEEKGVAGLDPADTAALDAFVKKVQDAHIVSTTISANPDAKKVDGQDAVIELNEVRYQGASNKFTINGMTITAQAATGEGDANAIQITTEVDTQGIYDQIKDFLTQYNSLVNEMTALYNADSARGYEPLTSEEKDSMTDDEIEKWEEKIKGSLLRRDDTLDSVISSMVTSMSASFEMDGKKYSLASFGIQTLGYLNAAENQQNAYHISGDKDDKVSSGSGQTDKLMEAIQKDADSVVDFMQKLTSDLYKNLDKKMKSTSMKSIYNVYNDKEMASEYSDYTDLIKKWEDKLTEQEDYYYKKFSAMETALTKLQSQTSSLSNLFGS